MVTWEFCSESGADAHQDSRVTTQTRGISRAPSKHTVVEPLDAAFCDPFIAARVVTVENESRLYGCMYVDRPIDWIVQCDRGAGSHNS